MFVRNVFLVTDCKTRLNDPSRIHDNFGVALLLWLKQMFFFLTRSEQISCAHSLFDPKVSTQESNQIFGKCTNLHGHNYTIIVTVRGEKLINGMLMNTNTLKEYIMKVILPLDHSNLNDHPYFSDKPSTTECLTQYIFTKLQELINSHENVELSEVEIKETDKNTVKIKSK